MSSNRTGADLIAAERTRQVDVEGWSAEHDDEHDDDSIAWAAVCYAAPDLVYHKTDMANVVEFADPWPWDRRFDTRPYNGNCVQPNDPDGKVRIRQLVKAGALIAAEIDRLLRKEKP
jgi:hypothetical protein